MKKHVKRFLLCTLCFLLSLCMVIEVAGEVLMRPGR